MTTVEFGCAQCGKAVEAAPGAVATCSHCQAVTSLADADTLTQCLACGCDELYKHRDFNQKLGIFIIVVGIILCFFMPSNLVFLPLLIAAAIDLVLYLIIPDVGICYRCKAHHRDFADIKALPSFDLERFEHYRFLKARDEGKIPPRKEPS